MTPQDLKKWRAQNGYSQSQLAEVLGVAVMTISRWERGAREIPSFLHLALECMEKRKVVKRENKGGDAKLRTPNKI
jgi:DNA-binding transcriptional regulator YiaG